ncbi:hypothetical protein [Herbiconiux sp. A18JL235]|uniref:Right handed beta helix domain-containing protein n=1 Tax=Herbiconiux sp. A18JL235 TaxID=3152363 RepID=A0AB39BFE5_9MICO
MMKPRRNVALGLFAAALALAGALAPGVSAQADPASCPAPGTGGRSSALPAPTVLTGSVHTTAANQVLDNVEIRGRLYIDHPGVVIRDSTLVGDAYYAVYSTAGGLGFTIQDSDVNGPIKFSDGSTVRDTHIFGSPGTILADGLFIANDLVTIDNVRIEQLRPLYGQHVDGIQITRGTGISITNSWIDPTPASGIVNDTVNAAIFTMGSDSDPVADLTISCNVLMHAVNSYYPLRLNGTQGTVTVTDNIVSDAVGSPPVRVTGPVPTTLVWSGNELADGTPISVPAPW